MGDKAISQRKRLAMGKKAPQGKAPVKMRGGGMVKKTGVKRMRGGGMVKKTGVKRFSGGGPVNLGRGSSEFAGRTGSVSSELMDYEAAMKKLTEYGLIKHTNKSKGKKD
tara:strand:+ start:334 stop:660 length:327 start_codon:yes stop_codon:yes gene_type:complete